MRNQSGAARERHTVHRYEARRFVNTKSHWRHCCPCMQRAGIMVIDNVGGKPLHKPPFLQMILYSQHTAAEPAVISMFISAAT